MKMASIPTLPMDYPLVKYYQVCAIRYVDSFRLRCRLKKGSGGRLVDRVKGEQPDVFNVTQFHL